MNKKLLGFLVVLLIVPLVYSMKAKAEITSDNVFEMKTKAVSLNKGDVVEVTFHVKNAETSGFAGYLEYDKSVLGELTIGQFVPTDYSALVSAVSGSAMEVPLDYGTWMVGYNTASNYLELTEKEKKYIKLPNNSDGLLLTVKFKVVKSAVETTIRMNYPAVYKKDGTNNYPSGLALTIKNTKTKKITLDTEAIKGHSSISIPVKVMANDGFSKLELAATYDPTKLVFDSVTTADAVKSTIVMDRYSIAQNGTKVIASFTCANEQKNVGTLFFFNFHAMDAANQTTTGTTEVAIAVDSVSDKAESAYVLTGAKSAVTITEKEHIKGDINGNGKIDLIDALYIIQYYNKTRTLSEVELEAADVNKNKTVDLVDALLIMQYYNGTVTSF